jgi:predicted transcriptional regulator
MADRPDSEEFLASGGSMDPARNLKEEAHRLVDQLPANASWDDLMYEVYVRQAVEAGLADADAGRVVTHEEALAQLRQRR